MEVGDFYTVLQEENDRIDSAHNESVVFEVDEEILIDLEKDFIDPWQEIIESFESEKEQAAESVAALGAAEQAFFKRFYTTARMEQQRFNVPFSIKMAQGATESNWGRSTLAVKANNHFGVKTTGKGYPLCDDDCNDRFKIYPSAWASWRAHSQFLTMNKRYAPLFADKFNRAAFAKHAKDQGCLVSGKGGCRQKGVDPKFNQKLNQLERDWNIPYKRWALGLDLLGYATDVNYSTKLIAMIERHGFHKHDNAGN